MAALCLNASLETLRPLCYRGTHRLQGDFCRCFHEVFPQTVQVGVTLLVSLVLQNSPQFIAQGDEVWTPRGPILGADKCRNVPPQPLLSRLGLVGKSWVLLEDPFLTTEESCIKEVSQLLVAHPLDTLGHQFSQRYRKNEEMWPPDGTPRQNHDVRRVMASLNPRNLLLRLTGCLSVNLVVLAFILLLDGEDFLVREENVFVPVLGVPLEERLSSCLSYLLQNGSKEVSLRPPVGSHV